MFEELEEVNKRPLPFEYYTASDLWADKYTSSQMLVFHLDEEIDVSSRKAEFINRSVEWITSKFNVDTNTSIIDFGCGPGLYTTRLAKKGADVTGIDFSQRSISYAQSLANEQGLKINYIDQNYLDFDADETFDLVLIIMCDFCALSPEQRSKLLAKFHKILKPDGAVLLDVYSLNAFDKRTEAAVYEENLLNGFWAAGKYYGFQNTFKYEQEKVVLDKYTIVEKSRTRKVYNWLQYFSPDSLEKEFKMNGFIVGELFSDVAGKPFDDKSSEFAVIAKRI